MALGNSPFRTKVKALGRSLEVLVCPASSPVGDVILVHEALGSVSAWKEFPEKLALSLQRNVLAYSRAGHGDSEGPLEPRSPSYYLDQAEQVLPTLVRHFDITSPVLYGHSEGAAIALLYAALGAEVEAVIAECPIVAREEHTLSAVQQVAANYESSGLDRKLERHHREPDKVFRSWVETIGNSPMMPNFPLQNYLRRVRCPVLVLQGEEDIYGGRTQYEVLRDNLPHVEHELYAGAGHHLHREQTEQVLQRVNQFLMDAQPGRHQNTTAAHSQLERSDP